MTDYSELKRLAEALNRAIAQAEHKPGEWAETAQSMGGICCPGEPFQIGKPWVKEEPWASFSYKRDSWLAVAAVNALPELLELIAENEALRKQIPSTKIVWCACGDGHAANSYGAGFMDANSGVCANCDAANGIYCESGDLSTKEHGESADLSTKGPDGLADLHKDAERYRWLRSQHWNESDMAVACHPKKSVKLGFDCPSGERLDHAIDAAMGKGEQV